MHPTIAAVTERMQDHTRGQRPRASREVPAVFHLTRRAEDAGPAAIGAAMVV